MDDARTLLHAIKPGWRGNKEGVWYCKAWEMEDRSLSKAEITKRIILESMKSVENYLDFTAEIGE